MPKQNFEDKKIEATIQIQEYQEAAKLLELVPFGYINNWQELLAYQIMSSYSYEFSKPTKKDDCIYGIPNSEKPLYLEQAQKYAKVVCDFFFLQRDTKIDWFKKGCAKASAKTLQQLENNFRQAFDIRARMYDLECYATAIEWKRPIAEQFFLPRRKCLHNLETIDGEKVSLIQDCQDFVDGKLDFLFNALPQRSGKTTLGITALSLMAIREVMNGGNKSIFGLTHSAGLARHFYNFTLRLFTDTRTYRTAEIFPECTVYFKSNEYREITLNKEQTYPTFAFKSIDGDVTGSTEASLVSYADDLVKDPSEVNNPDVAAKILDKANTYIFGRKKKGVPIFGNATLWGDLCPFTQMIEAYKAMGNDRIRIRLYSCFNSNGESQFDYEHNLGFDTKHFKEIEHRMSKSNYPLWSSLYLSKPVPVEGRLFESVKYFTFKELEEVRKNRNLFSCAAFDVAVKKGGDYYAGVFAQVDEVDRIVYITDVVYSNEGTDYTIPKTVEKILQHKVEQAEFEEKEGSNKTNQIDYGIKAEIKKCLVTLGYRCNLNNHSGASLLSKGSRIDKYGNEICGIKIPNGYITKFLCKEERETHKEYNLAMEHLFAYSQSIKKQGKQVDDMPDVLSQLYEFCIKYPKDEVQIYSMRTILPF